MAQKDLFDDSTMTFGEHLEVLRVHLWKAIIGLVIGSTAAFFFSNHIIVAIQRPVTAVMEEKFGHKGVDDLKVDQRNPFERLRDWWQARSGDTAAAEEQPPPVDKALQLELDARDVARQLHAVAPDAYPELPPGAPPAPITISLADTPFGELIAQMRNESLIPRTDGVDEAFMIYLKVSLVVGLIISSPWIFFQIWQFVAAGLYPHERKYVYSYLPVSLGLFLGGAFFCFYLVIPYVLGFLFEFNIWLHMRPEIKISTWITFVLVVSLMFGVSFQLPLVMLLLERISIVSVRIYREKRRYAILVIAILSMVLTPSDPVSMMMMMIPLCILYELGILLCARGSEKKSPFEAQPA
ncbi:MAG TPA: twin-arginine translocase subunit TatC [Planctomycetaceae bacterium]|nr:twin-arginine translocase subunit TatC [Planctomycetaceae bacterium]